jgi:predicted MFS family arabinose efflux permease
MTSPETAGPSPYRSSILLSYLCTMLLWGAVYIYMPILSSYAKLVSGSLQAAGLVIGAYGLSQIILRIPLGVWSDRLGCRKPFILLGFDGVANLGLILSGSTWMLFLSVFTSGIAASMWVPFTVLYASYFPLSRIARSMSLIMFFSRLAQICANYTGGKIADAWGWTVPFYVGLGLSVLGLLLAARISEVRPEKSSDLTLQKVLRVGRNRTLLTASFLCILMQFSNFAIAYGFSPIFAQQLGASKGDLGVLLFWYLLPNLAGTLLSGTFIRRYLADRWILFVGFLLSSGAVFSIPLTGRLSTLFLVQAVNGTGVGLVFPLLMGLSIQSIAREQQATAMGFFQSLYAIGMSVGPILSGIFAQEIGLTSVFVLNGILVFIGAVFSLVRVPSTPEERMAEEDKESEAE